MSGRREQILDAALALADERGLDAVSMRAVADRVGVTPMALYPHVGSKAALLDGMVGRLLAGLAPAAGDGAGDHADGNGDGDHAGGGDWQARLAGFARAGLEMTRRHPWSAALLFTRPSVAPDAVRAVDALYTVLLDAGVPPVHVPRVERLVSTFLLGFAASMAGGRFGDAAPDPRATRGGALPGHAALAAVLGRPVDWQAEFEADLADLGQVVARYARGEADGGRA